MPLIIGAILMIFMVFWSWAKVSHTLLRPNVILTTSPIQGLEDAFDGNHRSDLQNVIVREHLERTVGASSVPEVGYAYTEDDGAEEDEKYYVCDPEDRVVSRILPSREYTKLLQLARLPTCAVFHRTTSGKGVPHSFSAFIRQWPALPRVIVSVRLYNLHIFSNHAPDFRVDACHVDIARQPRRSLHSSQSASGQG